MIKFICDVCKKEIKKENNLFGNFTYLKRDYLNMAKDKRPRNDGLFQVEMLFCESCTEGMKKYIEGQLNINKDENKI